MKCDEVDRRLGDGSRASELLESVEIRAHIEVCPRCAELIEWSGSPEPAPTIRPAVDARLRAIATSDLTPVRAMASPAVLVPGVFVVIASVAAAYGLWMGVGGWLRLSGFQMALFAIYASVVAGMLAVCLVASIRPAARRVFPPLVPVLLLGAGFPLLAPLFPSLHSERYWVEGFRCLGAGLAVAGMSAGATLLLARRGFALDWGVTGALLGALGGTTAIIALQVACAVQGVSHLALWHGMAAVISILGGYWAGRRVTV